VAYELKQGKKKQARRTCCGACKEYGSIAKHFLLEFAALLRL
jgi:hypothetical protein